MVATLGPLSPCGRRQAARPAAARQAMQPRRQGGCQRNLRREAGCQRRLRVGAAVDNASEPRNASEPGPADATTRTVNVDLGDRSYPIYIGEGLLSRGELLVEHLTGPQVMIVTNETIAPLHLETLTASLRRADPNLEIESVVLPDGEQHKNMEVLMQIFDKALTCRFNRKSTFVALGGGVIGDMTGYAAASFQRGVNFVQVPTTVMAMVDSAVGGKTGVNHPLGKNMIGAFYQPSCVLADTGALATLPRRETASGVSEIIKYGLIWDAELFAWLEGAGIVEAIVRGDAEETAYAVERSCAIKAAIVAQDEREGGVRATLNLGHTFGHAIETRAGYGTYLHGEAVAIGTLMAADLSERLGWITGDVRQRTEAMFARAEQPSDVPADMTPSDFIDLMAVDKKNVDGKLRLVLLRGELGEW